jgi:hypothetical protein
VALSVHLGGKKQIIEDRLVSCIIILDPLPSSKFFSLPEGLGHSWGDENSPATLCT